MLLRVYQIRTILSFEFLNFSDKTGPACWLPSLQEFLPTAMPLLNIHKERKRAFLFLSTVQCPVAALFLPLSPDTWCIGRVGPLSGFLHQCTGFWSRSCVCFGLHLDRGLDSYLEHPPGVVLLWNLAWGQWLGGGCSPHPTLQLASTYHRWPLSPTPRPQRQGVDSAFP